MLELVKSILTDISSLKQGQKGGTHCVAGIRSQQWQKFVLIRNA